MKKILFTLMVFGIVGCDVIENDYWVCDGYSANTYDDGYFLQRHIIDFETGEIKVWDDWYNFFMKADKKCGYLHGEKVKQCIFKERGYFVKYAENFKYNEVTKLNESNIFIRFNLIDVKGKSKLGVLKLDPVNKMRAVYETGDLSERWTTKNFCSKNIPITWEG